MIATIDRFASAVLLALSTGIILGSLPMGIFSLYAIPFALVASAVSAAAGAMVGARALFGAAWGWPAKTWLIASIFSTLSLSGGILVASLPMGALSFHLIPVALGLWCGSFMAVLLSFGMRLTWAMAKQVPKWVVFSISLAAVVFMTLFLSTQTPLFMIPCTVAAWLLLSLKFKAKTAPQLTQC